MQITLVQAEIEAAITEYVSNRMTIREGMRIDIDLKATRGDAGYTAVIDIVEGNTPVAASVPAASAAPVAATVTKTSGPLGIASKISAAKAEPKVENEPSEPETEAESEPEVEAEEASAEKPKSIFGNLKKPVNEKTIETA